MYVNPFSDGIEDFLLADPDSHTSQNVIDQLLRQMLALLSKYSLTERQQKRLLQSVAADGKTEENADVAARVRIVVKEIFVHVIALFRSLIANSGWSYILSPSSPLSPPLFLTSNRNLLNRILFQE